LYFDAIVAVAYELMTRRTGDTANRARAFLQKIDEERLLTLAMLADAGDEVAVLVRFFDTKDHDIAKVSSVLKNFMNRIDALFLQRRCLESVDGCHTYTSFTLEMLREGKMLSIHEGREMKVRSLKAVPPELVDRCLSHMAAWREALRQHDHGCIPRHCGGGSLQCLRLEPGRDPWWRWLHDNWLAPVGKDLCH
jgi:hypothetical protein